jgi:hypothetical protein
MHQGNAKGLRDLPNNSPAATVNNVRAMEIANRVVFRTWGSIRVLCKNSGCIWTGEVIDLKTNTDSCFKPESEGLSIKLTVMQVLLWIEKESNHIL